MDNSLFNEMLEKNLITIQHTGLTELQEAVDRALDLKSLAEAENRQFRFETVTRLIRNGLWS